MEKIVIDLISYLVMIQNIFRRPSKIIFMNFMTVCYFLLKNMSVKLTVKCVQVLRHKAGNQNKPPLFSSLTSSQSVLI